MKEEKLNINLQYKDRLFRLLFGREENKENVLSLYNALNNSDYKDVSEVEYLKLSDAFTNPDKSGDFEWTAVLYNLNRGKNDELRIRCDALDGYMILVEKIRENLKQTSDVAKAVDAAVLACIDDGILKDFLLAHRAEVVDMVLTEFDEKSFVKGMKEEGREEGIREGRQSVLFSLVNEKILTLSDAASRAGLSEEEFAAEMEKYLKNHKSD